MDALDAEIRSVFPDEADDHPRRRPGRPADPRGRRARRAAGRRSASSRGQGHVPDGQRGRVPRRLPRRPPVARRVGCCSPTSTPGEPDAAFVKRQRPDRRRATDPRPGGSRATWCAPGPTPTPSRPARATPPTRDAALASGAQWVSTDYPVPDYAPPSARTTASRSPAAPSPAATRSTPRGAAGASCSTSLPGPPGGP